MQKIFRIQTLSDQATYNPNNPDVVQFKNSWNNNSHRVPENYRAWLETFYQYKTPQTNFTGREDAFNDLAWAKSLFRQFPKLFSVENDLLIKGVYNSIDADSAEGRQNKFVLLKDHYVLACIKVYFADLQGTTDAENKLNITKLIIARKRAEENYFYWLKARDASLQNSGGWFKKYLQPALAVSALVVSSLFPGGTIVGVPLATAIATFDTVVKHFQKNGNIWETEYNGDVYRSDGTIGKPGAPSGSNASLLPLAAIAGLILFASKGRA